MIARRDFLMGSALAVTAMASMGATGPKPARIGCGILGLGHAHALDVVKVLRSSEDFELVGVCEPDSAVRAEAEKFPVLNSVKWLSPADILGDPSVKMVAVEGLVPQLLNYAYAAADAGKHVHLDKPAGVSLPPFEALLAKMTQKNLLLQMGYMYRYNAGFDFARHAVREGWLGDVYRVNGTIDTEYTLEKRNKLNGRPGGMMFELGCHLIDMTMLILGTPRKITPVLRHDTRENDALFDNTAAIFEFDRAFAIIQSAAMRPNAFPTRRFEVCGTNGSVTIEPHEPPSVYLNLREPHAGFKKGFQKVAVEDHPRHVRDFKNLAACIRGESKFAYTKEHDLAVQRALLEASGVST